MKTFFEGGGREKREREKKASKFEISFPAFFFPFQIFILIPLRKRERDKKSKVTIEK